VPAVADANHPRAANAPSVQEALQMLFSEDFNPVAMNLDMIGVDEV
jgi:hypothetical protein